MVLTVQTNPPTEEADGYISAATYRLHADDHGYPYAGLSDTEIEQAIRRATKAVDAIGAGNWRGLRLTTSQQTAWPRANAVDADGFDIVGIPWQIMAATAEATKRELDEPNSLAPDVTATRLVVEEEVAGAVRRKYAVKEGSDVQASRPRLFVVEDLIAPLLNSSLRTGGTRVTTFLRA